MSNDTAAEPTEAADMPKINVKASEVVSLDELHVHPENYRTHPEEQIAHIVASLREHGFYRNVVIAKEGTILAGHGVVEASRRVGLTEIPVIRLNVDPDSVGAKKVLTGDNYLSHFAEDDDRALTEMLKEINDMGDLEGTGFDEQMLANLVMITRHQGEIEDADEAAEWVGMPEFEAQDKIPKLVINFRSNEDREKLVKELEWNIMKREKLTWTTWWPEKEREDLSSVRFEDGDAVEETDGPE